MRKHGPLKILFVMLHPGYVRNYEQTIRLLAQRGCRIRLGFNQPHKQAEDRLAEQLAAESANVTFGLAPKRSDAWRDLARLVRGVQDYLRYLHPRYAAAPRLRARVENMIPYPIVLLVRAVRTLGLWPVTLLARALAGVERLIPASKRVIRFIEQYEPDVVLVTPLVNMASDQVDYVKAARKLGIRAALCVASWDNLTNKGLLRVVPDMVLLWNEIQKREAVELHGISEARIVVTGAQRFDEWFERRPSVGREAFCAKAGLAPDKPFVLYLCSSPFIAPGRVEPEFAERWIRAIRDAGDPRISELGILVRPHPQNAGPWQNVDLSRYENVSIWPRQGANPVSEEAKSGFFDSLRYSEAVVGVNTSAFLEAGILGVPTLTVLGPEFAGSQDGTLHFHYLLAKDGGLLHTASDLEEHRRQLLECRLNRDAWRKRTTEFVASFLRPHGLNTPCTPIVADAIEELAVRRAVGSESVSAGQLVLQWCLWPLALVLNAIGVLRRHRRGWRHNQGRPVQVYKV